MDLLSFFTLLTAFLGFAAITAANPLQAREDTRATATSIASTMPTGVSALPANVPIPTGYTWGKLLYNTTIHGHSKQFSGHGMDVIFFTQISEGNPLTSVLRTFTIRSLLNTLISILRTQHRTRLRILTSMETMMATPTLMSRVVPWRVA